jgi:hypothetical protein
MPPKKQDQPKKKKTTVEDKVCFPIDRVMRTIVTDNKLTGILK